MDTQDSSVVGTMVRRPLRRWNRTALLLGMLLLGVGAGPFGWPSTVAAQTGERCDDIGFNLALQQDGKIVVVGTSDSGEIIGDPQGDHEHLGDSVVVRYLPNGRLDRTFGRGGKILTDLGASELFSAVAIDAQGRIVAVGNAAQLVAPDTVGDSDTTMVRYLPDGTLDPDFGRGGQRILDFGGADFGHAVAIDAQDRIIVAGKAFRGDDARLLLVRFLPDGTLDASFGRRGRVIKDAGSPDDQFYSVALDEGGHIVAGGRGGRKREDVWLVQRYLQNGQLDASFGQNGTAKIAFGAFAGASQTLRALGIDQDGKIVGTGVTFDTADSMRPSVTAGAGS
jgi:uncharacterized delta-60 repeat protein